MFIHSSVQNFCWEQSGCSAGLSHTKPPHQFCLSITAEDHVAVIGQICECVDYDINTCLIIEGLSVTGEVDGNDENTDSEMLFDHLPILKNASSLGFFLYSACLMSWD